MDFREQEYYEASLERIKQANSLYKSGDAYAIALYCGGLAVECLLRAFRWRYDKTFEGRHDLRELAEASKIHVFGEDSLRRRGESEENVRKSTQEFRAALNTVVSLWHNNLRFASEARLKSHLIKIDKVRGIKGDPLKKNASDLIEAAQYIINRGITLWSS